jgi:hypothetical protein
MLLDHAAGNMTNDMADDDLWGGGDLFGGGGFSDLSAGLGAALDGAGGDSQWSSSPASGGGFASAGLSAGGSASISGGVGDALFGGLF